MPMIIPTPAPIMPTMTETRGSFQPSTIQVLLPIEIPAGTHGAQRFRLRKRGMPQQGQGGQRLQGVARELAAGFGR
jgi:hypothetical protein